MLGVSEARAVLPGWLPWTPLFAHLPLVFLLSFTAGWLGARLALIPLRKAHEGHWTLRARHAYPARALFTLLVLAIPVLAGLWVMVTSGPLFHLHGRPLVALAAATAWVGSVLASWVCEGHVRGTRERLPTYLRSVAAVYVLLVPQVILVALAMLILPPRFGLVAVVLFAATVLALALHLRGGGLRLGQRLGLCAPGGERLCQAVKHAAEAIGQEPPEVYEIPMSAAYAAAIVTSRQLVFSRAVVDLLTDEELASVCAHELAHLNEDRRVKRLRVAAAFALLPIGLVSPVWGSFGATTYALVLVAVGATLLLASSKSRALEAHADHVTVKSAAPTAYARALERFYEHNLVPAQLFGTGGSHPHLYDRLAEAGVTPEYPRPPAPSQARFFTSYAPLLLLTMVLATADALLRRPATGASESRLVATLAATGGNRDGLHGLGHARYDRDDFDGAVALFAAASSLERGPTSTLDLVLALDALDHCQDAANALALAEDRASRHPSGREVEAFQEARLAVGDCTGAQAEPAAAAR